MPGISRKLVGAGDQAHAGDARFGFLQLGDVDLDDRNPALAQPLGDLGIAGGNDDSIAHPQHVRRLGLVSIDGEQLDIGELAGVDCRRVKKQKRCFGPVPPRQSGSGLEVQATAQLGRHNLEAKPSHDVRELRDAARIGARRQSHMERLADPQHVTAIDMASLETMDFEVLGESGGSGAGLAGAGSGPRTGDDRMLAEQQGRILDEYAVRIVGKIGQSNDFQSGIAQRLFIGLMLPAGFGVVDGCALLMGERAVRKSRADTSGEGCGRQSGFPSVAGIWLTGASSGHKQAHSKPVPADGTPDCTGCSRTMASIFSWPAAEVADEDLFGAGVQQRLSRWNETRLEPRFPDPDWQEALKSDQRMLELEGRFLDRLRRCVQDALARVPEDAEAFVTWFEGLERDGPGQQDPLFEWLASTASLDEMRWYLAQEAAGEAGFDDLTAYTQVKLPPRIKLELARNYWDEMGRGNPKGMHGPMLARLVDALALEPSIETTVAESLALANGMTAMATRRDYAWHAVGALGAIELTAPARSAAVAAGLKRLGLRGKDRLYFDLHATLDVKHSEAWNAEAIMPAVAEDPRRARAIAEGALMRLSCGARCFERYRRELW